MSDETPAELVEIAARVMRQWIGDSTTIGSIARAVIAAITPAIEARARGEGAKAMQEWAKLLVQQRMDDRFAEHGTTEWDTNASYYSGRRAEVLDELDEEDEAIRDAIAALDPAQIVGGKT